MTGNELHPSHALFHLSKDANAFLDIGCNVGAALQHAHFLGVPTLRGIEINPEAVRQAKERTRDFPDCEIIQGSADSLPYEDGVFDSVLCSEVLEHVPPDLRSKAVSEMARVLKPGGQLILTVPHAGAFAFLDPANVRFRLPALFRWVSGRTGGPGRDQGFQDQKHGVVWHHHFTMKELRELFEPTFKISTTRYRGAFVTPVGDYLLFPFYRKGAGDHPVARFIHKFQEVEKRVQFGPALSYNVLMVAKKAE